MKFKDWLEKWEMQSLRIKSPFLEMEWKLGNADRAAAWELYVELLTRTATQPLPEELGDEKSALERLQYLSSCFWDIDKTGQSEGIRLSNPPSWPLDTSQTGVQGKTTAQMMDPNTFIRSGWDYDTLWTQTSGQDYPRLKCLSTGFSSKEADDE